MWGGDLVKDSRLVLTASLQPRETTSFYAPEIRTEPKASWGKHNQYPGLPWGLSSKVLTCQCRTRKRPGFSPWVRKIPWRRAWQSTPVVLPGESHGQRSLAGYGPLGLKESDTTEVTQHPRTRCLLQPAVKDLGDVWGREEKGGRGNQRKLLGK